MTENPKRENAGGIAWAGSLVGSQRPDNLGFRYSHKRYKRASDLDKGEDDGEGSSALPANVVVQFKDREGTEVGNLVDIPTGSDVDALSSLVHSLLNGDGDEDEEVEKKRSTGHVPYSFYAKVVRDGVEDDIELTTTLANLIKEHKISTEEIISLTYQPLAVFRVRPVTRCADTMPGHTDAILHVTYSPDGTLRCARYGVYLPFSCLLAFSLFWKPR